MALGPVAAALKALIASEASVTNLLANAPVGKGGGPAIYDEGDAPQSGRVFPDITVGAGTAVNSVSGFRKDGWNCTVQVKPVIQGTEASGQAIVSALTLALPKGRIVTVAGFASSWVEECFVQPTIVTTVGGVVTREFPIIVRVFAT